jgi:SAM-dependent methyltransferase
MDKKEEYIQKATNPQQYDSPELDWNHLGAEDSTSRKFFRECLDEVLEDVSGKSVIDIGSGVGQLCNFLKLRGALEIWGIEPSKRNIDKTKELYPEMKIVEGTLDNVNIDNKFDAAIMIYVLEHIMDIDSAFSKINTLLKHGSNLYLIIGDKEFNSLSKPGFEVDVQELDSDTIVTRAILANEVMYNIYRNVSIVIDSAQRAGLELTKQVDKIPDYWKQVSDEPMLHLLVFSRV